MTDGGAVRQMPVVLFGNASAGVPEDFGDDRHSNAFAGEPRRRGVAEAVEAQLLPVREFCLADVKLEALRRPVGLNNSIISPAIRVQASQTVLKHIREMEPEQTDWDAILDGLRKDFGG